MVQDSLLEHGRKLWRCASCVTLTLWATSACLSDAAPGDSSLIDDTEWPSPIGGASTHAGGTSSGGSGTGAAGVGGASGGSSGGGSSGGGGSGGAVTGGVGGTEVGGALTTGGTVATGGTGGTTPSDEFAAVYAPESLVVFELTIPPECEQSLARAPDTYCAGTLAYRTSQEGPVALTLAQVGIRLKGEASFRDLTEKAAFKIKVDEFVPNQRFFGLRRITLNNMVQDASMMHERIGYGLFRKAGVPAPLCNHARVYVNGNYFGLYANVQSADDEFFEHLYGVDAANLYDILNYDADLRPGLEGNFELETNRATSTNADLSALIQAVNGPASSFLADADVELDWAEWLAVGAMQAMIADWDGYFGAHNNFKLYHHSTGFQVIPWGIDQTFGTTDSHPTDPTFHLDYAIDGSTSDRGIGRVFERCQVDDTCWEQYLDAVEGALAIWESHDFAGELSGMRAQLATAIAEDTRREYSNSRIQSYQAGLETFVSERAGLVRTQLLTYGRNPL